MTKEELTRAARNVFDDNKAFDAIIQSSVSFPEIVKMAALEGFIYEVDSPDVEVVREALMQLRSLGWFEFEDE